MKPDEVIAQLKKLDPQLDVFVSVNGYKYRLTDLKINEADADEAIVIVLKRGREAAHA